MRSRPRGEPVAQPTRARAHDPGGSRHTNIIVSALLQPLGPPAQVFLLALGDTVQMCVSGGIFAEYEEVIRRPRLRRTEETFWVKPSDPVRACSDPDDDVFLECAQASGASYVVTGDVRDFPLRWVRAEIVTPRHFLEIVAARAL
jgi:uncharacterized protein